MRAKLPAGRPLMEGSSLSAMPTPNDPEMTVRFSSVGCQCGMIFWPAGILSRTTNSPVFVGSPASTAILIPFGRFGGASAHCSSFGVITLCSDGVAGACERASRAPATSAHITTTTSRRDNLGTDGRGESAATRSRIFFADLLAVVDLDDGVVTRVVVVVVTRVVVGAPIDGRHDLAELFGRSLDAH